MEKNKIVILIPSFNELKNLKTICKFLKKNRLHFIVLDDNSKDGSNLWLKKNNMRFIRNNINLGYESNLNKGISFILKKKKYDFLITFDGDGEHKLFDIIRVIKFIKKNDFDLLICNRQKLNRWSEYLLSFFYSLFFNLKDPLSGFKVYKISKLRKFEKKISSNLFLVDIINYFIKNKQKIKNFKIQTNVKYSSKIGHGFKIHTKIIQILFYSIIN